MDSTKIRSNDLFLLLICLTKIKVNTILMQLCMTTNDVRDYLDNQNRTTRQTKQYIITVFNYYSNLTENN